MSLRIPSRYNYHYNHPWTKRAKYSPGFRFWLAQHKLLTPHFSYEEAKCRDGTYIPARMRFKARNHAFKLERLRHDIGGSPLHVISWYRTKSWNKTVGGARNSQHIKAIATDFSAHQVDRIGRTKFMKNSKRIFKNDGIGIYPGGSVHLDSRGYMARWDSWNTLTSILDK